MSAKPPTISDHQALLAALQKHPSQTIHLDVATKTYKDCRHARLRRVIVDVGVPLKEYSIATIGSGLVTGLDEILVINSVTQDAPVARDRSRAEIRSSILTEALSEKDCLNRLRLEAELNDRVTYRCGLTAEEKKNVDAILPAAKDDGGGGDDGGYDG